MVGLGLAGGVGVPLGLVGVVGGLGPGGFVLFDGAELVGDVGVVPFGDAVPCGVSGEVGGVVDVVCPVGHVAGEGLLDGVEPGLGGFDGSVGLASGDCVGEGLVPFA